MQNIKIITLIFLIPLTIGCGTENSMDSILNDTEDRINDNNDDTGDKVEVIKVVDLVPELNETSGLIIFNDKIITHNDSGDQAYLYEIEIASGEVKRKVEIINVIGKDIEDICQDESYIYVADVGNNSNQRTDLVIYKINKSDYLINDAVTAELIEISYNEQSDFSNSNNSTNFDAEAIISIGNDLFLFTKNWIDLKTSVYKIPKDIGNYQLNAVGNYDIGGLITGASYNQINKNIVLTGYLEFSPFVARLSGFSSNNPLDGKVEKENINVNGSIQIEGVATYPNGAYLLSAESIGHLPASLYELIFN